MNGTQMLEKMDLISPEFVQEAAKPFQAAKKSSPGRIIMLYASGMAAGLVLLLVSASMLIFNRNTPNTEPGATDVWAATAFLENGSLPLILLIVSIAVIALFAFLLIRRKKRDR